MISRTPSESLSDRPEFQPPPQVIRLELKLPPEMTDLAMQLLTRMAAGPPAPPPSTSATWDVPPDPPAAPPEAASAPTPPAGDPRSLVDLYRDHVADADADLADTSTGSTLSSLRHFDAWLLDDQAAAAAEPPDDYRINGPVSLQSKTPVFSPIATLQADRTILHRFARHQIVDDGKSPKTARRKLTAVLKVLRALQKRDLVSRLPDRPTDAALRKMAGPITAVDDINETVTLSEMLALREACSVATWPGCWRVPAPDYWRFLVDVCWTYGPRLCDWFAYRDGATKQGLLWSQVHFDAVCPAPQLKGFESPHGWVWVLIHKTKRLQLLPLSARIREHLERWRGVDAERVVPLGSVKKSQSQQWRKIVAAAGVDPRIRLSEGQTIPSLRKGCSVHWEAVSEEVATYVLGHRSKTMRGQHYGQIVRKVAAHIDNVPFGPADGDCRTQL